MDTARKLIAFVCFLTFALVNTYTQESTGPDWRMAVLKKTGPDYESLPFREPLAMTGRDVYQVYLAFEGEGYCYVVQEDDEGNLPLVYKKNVSRGEALRLPEDISAGAAESPDFRAASLSGTSRVFVVVSARPRTNMERLIERYLREPDSVSLGRSILSEVLAAKRSVSSLPDTGEAALPSENDPAMRGGLWFFKGRDTWVVTVTVRS